MIDRATVDKIIDAAKIVDVVSEFVTLRKSGVNYKGLCPFHDDKNPSFMVSPAKNICHCFVCGKGGTPAGFLMEHEQITYPEALRWLAKKYNIEIVEKELTNEELQEQNDRESMFVVNEWAKDYFHRTLKEDPDGIAIGKQYFRSRGIRDDIIEKFQLGFALPKRTALASAAHKAGYKPEFLVKTGLCYYTGGSQDNENDNRSASQPSNFEELRDRYAGRVIFPWFNISGRVVAFGGRLLDSRTKGVQQKYVNSPDSDIYHKERELYGLFQAKRAIVKEDRVFMVEGYTDVIAMHQAGIENVVANSGTALSTHQIHLLHRFTQNITLLYDGDEAGIHAAMRGTDMLLADGMNIKVLLLPDGDDPDSFARKNSSEQLRQYIEEHQTDFITFKSQLTVEGVTDPVKRSEAISNIVKSIAVIPDQILRSTYLTDFSRRIGMKEQTLLAEMNKNIRRNIEERQKEKNREERNNNFSNTNTVTPQDSVQSSSQHQVPLTLHSPQEQASQVELLLIREVVRHGEEIIYDQVETTDGQFIQLSVADYIDFDLSQDNLHFSSPLSTQILAEAVAHGKEPGFKAETYFCSHPNQAISQLATRLAIDRHQLGGRFVVESNEDNVRQRVLHLIMDFRQNLLENRMKELQRQFASVKNDMEKTMKLMQEYKSVSELRNVIARKLGNDLSI